MFKLRFFDCNQVEIHEGDTIKIYAGNTTIFYSEVKYLQEEKVLVPFHNFAWFRFEKVNTVPLFAIKSDEARFNLWYEPDVKHNYVPQELLISWRDAEVLLEKRCWQITKY